jgi:hypothetical protein
MKQLIVILLAAIVGGAGGYLISKSSHKCSSEQCKDCSKKTPAKPKVAKGLYQQASEKQMWYEVKSFVSLMKEVASKNGKKSNPVKFGGFINKHAVAAAIASLPDSIRALRFYLGVNSKGNLSLFFVGGALQHPLIELAEPQSSTVSTGALIITEDPNIPTDSDTSPVYCPPTCLPKDISVFPPIIIDPAIQPADDVEEGTGGTD